MSIRLYQPILQLLGKSPMTVEQYLKADRQWPHHLRVAHATMQLRHSPDSDFWKAVLAANDKKLH